MFIDPIFQGQLIEKKLDRQIIVWVLGRVEKLPKNGQKSEKKNVFVVLNKYQSVTHVFKGCL